MRTASGAATAPTLQGVMRLEVWILTPSSRQPPPTGHPIPPTGKNPLVLLLLPLEAVVMSHTWLLLLPMMSLM